MESESLTRRAPGFHVRPGQPHAEPSAFADALNHGHPPEALAGSTVYVTLEPCSHYGRTPPCVLAILERRCARVVVGVMDPDPQVAGNGLRQLRSHGGPGNTGTGNRANTELFFP